MKTTLLLPNGFKKIGWAIFVPAFLLGCSICFFGENFDRWLFRETVMNNIAIIGDRQRMLFWLSDSSLQFYGSPDGHG